MSSLFFVTDTFQEQEITKVSLTKGFWVSTPRPWLPFLLGTSLGTVWTGRLRIL